MKRQVIITTLLFALIASCTPKGGNQPHAQPQLKVSAITITPNEIQTQTPYIGVVESQSEAKLSFSVPGTVSKIYVKQGQQVNKGKLLISLNAPNIEQSLRAAEATYAQAKDGFKRAEALHKTQSIPEIDYIKAKSAHQQALSALSIAQKNVEDTKLYAPHSGYIGRIVATQGESALPSAVMLTLIEMDCVSIKIAVAEGEISAINIGDSAIISVVALDDKPISGRVSSKGVSSNPLSHTYEVMVQVDNQDGRLLAGMISKVAIVGESRCGIVVPNQAVVLGASKGRYVWVVEDGVAQRRQVQIQGLSPMGVVVTQGINYGDIVITEGYQRVSQGDKVEVIQ